MDGSNHKKLDICEGSHRQKCKVCGCQDKFDFHVLDAVWKKVVPTRFRNKVVCLACFDEFACRRRIDYADHLEELYFAGDRAMFKFQPVAAENIENV
jgi:hypothetical protein